MSRYKGIKGTAWNWVKKIVRQRETDCYTCEAKYLESYNAQSGHYQPVGLVGSNNTKSWDLRFIKLQCGRCNGVGQGMQGVFRKKLVEELGEEIVADFDRRVLAKEVSPVFDWDALIEEYKEEFKILQDTHISQ